MCVCVCVCVCVVYLGRQVVRWHAGALLLCAPTRPWRGVADGEADLAAGKISVNSPIGKGLLGKRVGEIAEIQVPNGIIKFEIISISR